MKSRAAGIALLAVLAVAGSCELKLSPTKSANFLLSPGQTARAQELRVEFLEVLEDSRCPANTECVGPGDAIVLFRLRTSTANPSEVELHVVDPARRAAVFDGYIVELQIPLQTLRFAAADLVPMNLVFFRKVSRIGYSYSWPEMLPGQWVFDRPSRLVFENLKPRRRA